MAQESLQACSTVDTFVAFINKLDARVGKTGGRYFVFSDGKQSYTMNQIVYQFKKIVEEKLPDRMQILQVCSYIKRLEESEIFEALIHPDNTVLALIKSELTKVRQVIGNFVFKITHNGFDRRAVLDSLILKCAEQKLTPQEKYFTDKYSLIASKEKIDPSHFSWLLNLGLLRIAEEGASPEEKKQIRFLAANFLSKSAPIQLTCWRPFFKKISPKFEEMFEKMFQVGPFDEYWYHRESVTGKSDFIPTDSIECSHLFPLKFTVLDRPPSVAAIAEVLKTHFLQDPVKRLKESLPLPFLFDLTGLSDKEVSDFRSMLESAISQVVEQISQDIHPLASHKSELREFLSKNIMSIARIEEAGKRGIKVLPVPSQKLEMGHLVEFIKLTGLYLGAITLRREALDAFGRQEVTYLVPATKKGVSSPRIYQKKEDFLHTALFQRLSSFFASGDAQADPMAVLGKGTMRLLAGLLEEISPEKWHELNQNPSLGQIFQASLLMIKEHLAQAELCVARKDFSRFAQEIELIHAEMATILELARPFNEADFEGIYKETVASTIPSELHYCYKGGRLGKTAMNIFAGINSACTSLNPSPQRVYGKNIYFEQQLLIGENHQLDEIKNTPGAVQVDLYVAQFNPNINVDPKLTEYKREDVVGNIRYLLNNGKAAKHLTVAVDCTIEKTPSNNVKELLEVFKEEIKAGKINFVIFGSGQKFDMLGMDNYYGAPFYMVNNGDTQWKAFDTLFTHPIHRTDLLSTQWFCLANKHALGSLAEYKELIFKNTRNILDHIPKSLQPTGDPSQHLKVNSAEKAMDVCFVDIKRSGANYKSKSFRLMEQFYEKMLKAGVKVYSRQSFGFYHPCILVFDLPSDIKASTTRLTPGINPADNEAIIAFFQDLAK